MQIDYSRIDISEILEKYNVRNIKDSAGQISFSCPFPEHDRGDRRPSAGINSANGLFHCFGCGRSGTLVSLVAEIEDISYGEAARKLGASYEASYTKGSKMPPPLDFKNLLRGKRPGYEPLDESVLDQFYINWKNLWEFKEQGGSVPAKLSYLFSRGLSARTLTKAEVGFDTRTNRFTFPYRNIDGSLVGVKGRASDDYTEPRYTTIGDKHGDSYGFPTFKKGNYVYCLDKISTSELAVVVEGEIDVLALRQEGFFAVGISGSEPTKRQLELLDMYLDELILMFDPDNSGLNATRKIVEALVKSKPDSRIAKLEAGDPAECTDAQIEEAIAQATTFLSYVQSI